MDDPSLQINMDDPSFPPLFVDRICFSLWNLLVLRNLICKVLDYGFGFARDLFFKLFPISHS